MARYGHCKSCWWWNRTGKKTGICWFQTRDEENIHYSDIDSYCPDHHNRLKSNKESGTLKQWLEEGGHKYITYKELDF